MFTPSGAHHAALMPTLRMPEGYQYNPLFFEVKSKTENVAPAAAPSRTYLSRELNFSAATNTSSQPPPRRHARDGGNQRASTPDSRTPTRGRSPAQKATRSSLLREQAMLTKLLAELDAAAAAEAEAEHGRVEPYTAPVPTTDPPPTPRLTRATVLRNAYVQRQVTRGELQGSLEGEKSEVGRSIQGHSGRQLSTLGAAPETRSTQLLREHRAAQLKSLEAEIQSRDAAAVPMRGKERVAQGSSMSVERNRAAGPSSSPRIIAVQLLRERVVERQEAVRRAVAAEAEARALVTDPAQCVLLGSEVARFPCEARDRRLHRSAKDVLTPQQMERQGAHEELTGASEVVHCDAQQQMRPPDVRHRSVRDPRLKVQQPQEANSHQKKEFSPVPPAEQCLIRQKPMQKDSGSLASNDFSSSKAPHCFSYNEHSHQQPHHESVMLSPSPSQSPILPRSYLEREMGDEVSEEALLLQEESSEARQGQQPQQQLERLHAYEELPAVATLLRASIASSASSVQFRVERPTKEEVVLQAEEEERVPTAMYTPKRDDTSSHKRGSSSDASICEDTSVHSFIVETTPANLPPQEIQEVAPTVVEVELTPEYTPAKFEVTLTLTAAHLLCPASRTESRGGQTHGASSAAGTPSQPHVIQMIDVLVDEDEVSQAATQAALLKQHSGIHSCHPQRPAAVFVCGTERRTSAGSVESVRTTRAASPSSAGVRALARQNVIMRSSPPPSILATSATLLSSPSSTTTLTLLRSPYGSSGLPLSMYHKFRQDVARCTYRRYYGKWIELMKLKREPTHTNLSRALWESTRSPTQVVASQQPQPSEDSLHSLCVPQLQETAYSFARGRRAVLLAEHGWPKSPERRSYTVFDVEPEEMPVLPSRARLSERLASLYPEPAPLSSDLGEEWVVQPIVVACRASFSQEPERSPVELDVSGSAEEVVEPSRNAPTPMRRADADTTVPVFQHNEFLKKLRKSSGDSTAPPSSNKSATSSIDGSSSERDADGDAEAVQNGVGSDPLCPPLSESPLILGTRNSISVPSDSNCVCTATDDNHCGRQKSAPRISDASLPYDGSDRPRSPTLSSGAAASAITLQTEQLLMSLRCTPTTNVESDQEGGVALGMNNPCSYPDATGTEVAQVFSGVGGALEDSHSCVSRIQYLHADM